MTAPAKGLTTAALLRLDLSDGEIRCPVKGVLGIMRCEARQAETAEAGAACTCPVFREFRGVRGADLKQIPVLPEVRRKTAPRTVKVYVHKRLGAVLEFMRRGRRLEYSLNELASVLGGNKDLAGRMVRLLLQDGQIERTRHAHYRLGNGDA